MLEDFFFNDRGRSIEFPEDAPLLGEDLLAIGRDDKSAAIANAIAWERPVSAFQG